MSIFESIIYGIVAGLTQFLPVSSVAHQTVIRHIFGAESRIPLQDLFVHVGVLLSILFAQKSLLTRLLREHQITSRIRRKRQTADRTFFYDLKLLKSATLPLLICLLLNIAVFEMDNNFLLVVLFLLINAVVLFITDHSSRGNKDASRMTGLDGIIMGISGALSAFPGISRTGMIISYSISRGANMQNGINWAVLLSIPALFFAVLFDGYLMTVIAGGSLSFLSIISYLFSSIGAFAGGYAGISLLQLILNRSGFSSFAYYSFGTALFTFILYLIT